jgi:ribosomal protein S18 acetylase RimI-like enzyme
MNVRIRGAMLRDARVMEDIDRMCFPPRHAYSKDYFEAMLDHPDFLSLIAENDRGEMVGFIVVDRDERAANLVTIDVIPGDRRRGTGSALLDQALAHEALIGVEKIFLQVYTGNLQALAFYQRHGFGTLGKIRDYYGKNENALLMARTLVQNHDDNG